MNQKTLEKSSSSASFFWIRAFPSPLSTNTLNTVMKTVTSAMIPYCSGIRIRASSSSTSSLTPCAPMRSASRHRKFIVTVPALPAGSVLLTSESSGSRL